jgi:hypothetical protein
MSIAVVVDPNIKRLGQLVMEGRWHGKLQFLPSLKPAEESCKLYDSDSEVERKWLELRVRASYITSLSSPPPCKQ